MTSLDILSQKPRSSTWPTRWKELTAGAGLYEACHEAVRSGRGSDFLAERLEKWCDYAAANSDPSPSSPTLAPEWQREHLLKLAECTRAAGREPDVYRTEVDRLAWHMKSDRERWDADL